jgi:hypothetical protein
MGEGKIPKQGELIENGGAFAMRIAAPRRRIELTNCIPLATFSLCWKFEKPGLLASG